MLEISPQVAREMLRTSGSCQLLDVREPWETAIVHIKDALHIPMQHVPDRLAEIGPDCDIIVLCHHGHRSRVVGHFLEQKGYPRVFNLQGGIDAWAREIDASLASY